MKFSPTLLARITLVATLSALASMGGVLAWRLSEAPTWLNARHAGLVAPFAEAGVLSLAAGAAAVTGIVAVACATAAIAAMLPGRISLAITRTGFWAAYIGLAAWLALVTCALGVIGAEGLAIDGLAQDTVTLFKEWWTLIGPALLPLVMTIFGHVQSWRASTIASFTATGTVAGDSPVEAAGDRILENVRTGGPDPQFRRSWLTSAWGHLLVIVIIPWMVQSIGCTERYQVPHGSGEEAVAAVVQVTKPVKKKKRRFLLNLESAIILTRPDIDDSEIEASVERASELTYTADTSSAQARAAGKLGKGGGKDGGWPDGVGDDPIRFLRIKHTGPGWDDGMDELSRADVNFLEEFKRVTGFKIARTPEARTIQQLRFFEKGFAPPFMYLTGTGSIPINGRDAQILREYLLGGGMLFADAGSPEFHTGFLAAMAAVFPDRQLVTIADDDPIFQSPFVFPNGAPPLWHHGGYRALGIKHKNRWVVFYHPGDLNDAWKTGGSGMSRELSDQSYKLGINILYHAFTHYLDMTRKLRK